MLHIRLQVPLTIKQIESKRSQTYFNPEMNNKRRISSCWLVKIIIVHCLITTKLT